MFHTVLPPAPRGFRDVAALLDRLAATSTRPRYSFMLLSLIAEAAGPDGQAGPTVARDGARITLRDWLSDALTPMGGRDPRRLALAERVRENLQAIGQLPADPGAAQSVIDIEVRNRARASGKTNLSRAVSELVAAGLLRRHYQGYCVDHENRGAQRQAVYTLIGPALALLAPTTTPAQADKPGPATRSAKTSAWQGELAL